MLLKVPTPAQQNARISYQCTHDAHALALTSIELHMAQDAGSHASQQAAHQINSGGSESFCSRCIQRAAGSQQRTRTKPSLGRSGLISNFHLREKLAHKPKPIATCSKTNRTKTCKIQACLRKIWIQILPPFGAGSYERIPGWKY